MAGIGQYLKETRSEMRHVAWPTRLQTVMYTALVIAISLAVALYLGIFDYLFSQGLGFVLGNSVTPNAPVQAQQVATGTLPANSAPSFSASSTTGQ